MSLEALTAIWRSPPCGGGDLLCLLAIADNADDRGYAWPSIGTIARKAAMSERGAQKCLRRLEDAGLLLVEIGGGRGRSNAYQITTNGMGEGLQHKNPDQNTPNAVRPSKGVNPEQSNTNPEQSCNKPRTPVHPNPIEPSIEQNDDDEGACEFEDLTFREKVLLAMGHDRTGLTATGRIVCNPSQMIEVNRWIDDLALSQQEILMVIEATPCREGAPSSPKFYTHEMQKFAGEKVKPKLQPIATQGGGHSASKTAHKKSVEDDIAEAKRLRAERMAKGETR